MNNRELRDILSSAASPKSGVDEAIQQLLYIVERQADMIDRMEREIAVLRQHIIDIAGDLRTVCPIIDEANRSGDQERAQAIVRRYYADIKRSNDGRGKEN